MSFFWWTYFLYRVNVFAYNFLMVFKLMKFFNYENEHFSENTFSNIRKKPLKFKYINLCGLCHLLYQVVPINSLTFSRNSNSNQSRNALKLNSLVIFLKKCKNNFPICWIEQANLKKNEKYLLQNFLLFLVVFFSKIWQKIENVTIRG